MTSRRLWVVVGPAALAAGAGVAALELTTNHVDQPVVDLVLRLLLGWSWIAAGIVAWTRRPYNRTGILIAGVGFAWFVGSLVLANGSVPFTVGLLLDNIFLAVFVQLLLAFPEGVLERRQDRIIVVSGYAAAFLVSLGPLLVERRPDFCDGPCPTSAIAVVDNHAAHLTMNVLADLAGVAILGAVGVIVVRRWRRASAAARRVVTPVLLSGGAAALFLVGNFAFDQISPPARDIFGWLALACFLALPFLFLAGLLRGRLARADVGRLFAEVPEHPSPEELRAAFRRVLHDPSAELLHWLPDRGYVDGEGTPVDARSDPRVLTPVEYEGRRLGALLHDATLLHEPELLEAAMATARIGLEKERLGAELRARLAELEREQQYVRTVIDAAPPMIVILDDEGLVRRINAAVVDLCCRPGDPDVHLRRFWEVFLPQEDHELARAAVAAARRSEFGVEHETGWLAAGGGRHVVAWTLTPIVNAKGEPRFLLTGMDVTERKRQETQTRALLAAIPDTMLRVRRDGVVIDFHAHPDSDAAARMMTAANMIGTNLWDRSEQDVVARLMGAAERALDTGTLQTLEYELRAIDHEARILPSGEDEVFVIVRDVTERKRQEEELRRSRARIVEAADGERRRLERNLHDGAQQRLVSLSLTLRLAHARLVRDPAGAEELLTGAQQELAHALEELRELARGIHPAILTDRGLGPALEALATRAPLPVELDALPAERLPDAVEAAAYYVVAEGLTNVVKYAGASSVHVSVERRNGQACVEIVDDGVGGADPQSGTGLRGLADRVEALDGRLLVESAPGAGTRLRAEIPV